MARQYRKPRLHLSRERDGAAAARELLDFLGGQKIKVLNVAGPRRSQEPEVAGFACETLGQANFGL